MTQKNYGNVNCTNERFSGKSRIKVSDDGD